MVTEGNRLENLEATLAVVRAEVRRLDLLQQRAARGALNPLRALEVQRLLKSHRQIGEEPQDPQDERRVHDLRLAFLQRVCTSADQQSALFSIAASPFRLEALTQHLERVAPGADPEALLKIHALSTAHANLGNPRSLFAGVIAAAGLLSNLVPKPVIEDLGWSEADFQRATFYIVLVALIYLGVIVGAALPSILRTRRVNRLTHDVLTYWSIRRSSLRSPRERERQTGSLT